MYHYGYRLGKETLDFISVVSWNKLSRDINAKLGDWETTESLWIPFPLVCKVGKLVLMMILCTDSCSLLFWEQYQKHIWFGIYVPAVALSLTFHQTFPLPTDEKLYKYEVQRDFYKIPVRTFFWNEDLTTPKMTNSFRFTVLFKMISFWETCTGDKPSKYFSQQFKINLCPVKVARRFLVQFW